MYTVYVIKDANETFYKGVTNNLERRLAEHARGQTKTTRRMTSIQVVYTEQFIDFPTARKRELYLKSAAGRKFLKKIMPL
jgi:putative endonuclease